MTTPNPHATAAPRPFREPEAKPSPAGDGELGKAARPAFVPGRALPLHLVRVGATATVTAVTGAPELRARLGSLGFVEATAVKVISAADGNLIVEVKGARLAIGRSMARHVMTD